jgi:hypothetical protein
MRIYCSEIFHLLARFGNWFIWIIF